MSLVRLSIVCLFLAAGMAGAKVTHGVQQDQGRVEAEVQEILADIKRSPSVHDYIHRLNVYETFKHNHKHSKACMPAAPELSERPKKRVSSHQERRCATGFKRGERHGKMWAQIIVRDGRDYAEGLELVKALLGHSDAGSHDVLPVCAFKGAKMAYTRWHERYTTPAKMNEYEKLEAEQPHEMTNPEASIVSNDAERDMTAEEIEYVKAVGTSEYTEATIHSEETQIAN